MSYTDRPPGLRDDPHGYGMCFVTAAVLLVIMLGVGAGFIFAGLLLLERLL